MNPNPDCDGPCGDWYGTPTKLQDSHKNEDGMWVYKCRNCGTEMLLTPKERRKLKRETYRNKR